MSMSVDGLISGMDTTSLINQLIQAEAGPQTALKTKLSATQTAASAYRTVNTTFAAVRAAAEAALKADSWTPVKATASSTSVAVTASTGATRGSLTFSVEKLATGHAVVNRNTGTWTSATAAYGSTSIEIFDKANASKGPAISLAPGATIADAAAAINASSYGLSAAVVEISETEYALQVTSRTSCANSEFSVTGSGTFGITTQAQSAELRIGTGPAAYDVTSATNTFASVMPGATLTVSTANPGAAVTVSVDPDPDAVAAKVQSLVDAVNSAVSNVRTYTNNTQGSRAALKGDFSVSQLAGQLLDAVSFAIGADGSPAQVGFELTRDGKVTFDKAKFLTALADDPTMARRMVAGVPAGTAADGTPVAAVTGLADRLLAVSKTASDSATGSLVKLAEGQDSMVKDITDRIAAWDLRLAKRKETLTRQFSAMETALSSLKNQSTWLAGQINSLPTYG
jgi:flagellar capping protein FliD